MTSGDGFSWQQSLALGIGEQLELGDGDPARPDEAPQPDAHPDFDEDEDEDEDEDDPDTGWVEVEDLAREWSHVWADGSEIAWLRYGWGALHRSGLIRLDDPVDRAASIGRLLAMVTLYRVFQVHAHDLEHVDEWHDAAHELTETSRVGAFTWGVLAAREGLQDVIEDDEDLPRHFSHELIRHYAPQVARALTADLGENFLFASLWASSALRVRFPLTDRRYHAAVNEDPDEKYAAYNWLSDGMPL